LGDGLLRELRLSHRTVGGGTPAAGARSLVPEPVGLTGGIHHRPALVAAIGGVTDGLSVGRV
jgi:hypothetical protein